MRLHFRFKIALISFLVSGALLTAVGITFFVFTYQSGMKRMDRELRSIVETTLRGGHPPAFWQSFEESLQVIYGSGESSRISLLVCAVDDRIVFQSESVQPELLLLPRPVLSADDPQRYARVRYEVVQRLDRDLDDLVSLEEFDGPEDVFGRADADGNGFLTAREAMRIHQPPVNAPPRNGGGGFQAGGASREQFEEPQAVHVSKFMTFRTKEGNWRAGILNNEMSVVVVAMDMDWFYADINRFRFTFLGVVPIGLLLLGVTGWFLAARAMRPVAIIADTAEGITAKGLDRRIPPVGSDVELERLVTVVNGMLDRLEKSYCQAVRFSADAAHELQTPLTILQGELDNAIQGADDGSREQQCYSMLLDELRNLKAVVQKLLLLAHADEGRLNVSLLPVDLSDLVSAASEDFEMMAPELEIKTEISPGIKVAGDSGLLNQTLRNMASNAAKYTADQGCVSFSLKRDRGLVRFTLSNTASSIPEADRPLLFERFHRVEKSRTTAGSGLGLSLAREIARAHGGDLVLDPAVPGVVSFSLFLPESVV